MTLAIARLCQYVHEVQGIQSGPANNIGAAPVAQLDRAPDYESGGRAFESLRVHHFFLNTFKQINKRN